MSREIKFRVWDGEKYLHHSGGKFDREWIYLKVEGGIWSKWGIGSYTKNLVLQQYTGLKDKNGVEIYEGDYVKITNHRWILADGQKEEDTQYLVEWSGIGFDFRLLNGYFMQGCGRNSEPEYEVVGNIFEKEP